MALTPDEVKVLETIEAGLRAGDPALAAAFSATRWSFPSERRSAPSRRHVLHLVALLVGLAAVSTRFAEQLGVVGLGVLTCVAVVPWLVCTARSADCRSGTSTATQER